MTYILRFLLACAAAGAVLTGLAGMAHADTVIDSGYLPEGGHWLASGNPFLIQDTVSVPSDQSLTIDPGVSMVIDPSLDGYQAFTIHGNLYLNGDAAHHISVSGPGSMAIFGTSSMKFADISLTNGMAVINTRLEIASSTISGASTAIDERGSTIDISGSRLVQNQVGLLVEAPSLPVFQVRADSNGFGIGGIGNALDDPNSPAVSIRNSVIMGNSQAAIKNNDALIVDATQNWWGSDAGPMTSPLATTVIGNVLYTPWLTTDPNASSTPCCSSILFLPGLEGTRLYRPESLPLGLGTMTNRLWEPNRNADLKKLYLNASGLSTDNTIYSGDPIGSAYGFKDIYGKFMSFLDGLVQEGTVGEWKAFGYDWRRPVPEVVAGAEKKATTSVSLIQTLEDLAARSKTGKVTIVAHSNGGLVAKYLVKTLVDMGKSSLIDTVISVAVPYLGTPEAIAALLHGDDQAIFASLFASKASARGLGVNMATAYSLLPSAEYFAHIFTPSIAFASTTIPSLNNGSYPQKISNEADQTAFIVNAGAGRTAATFGDTVHAVNGNPILIAAADVLHGILDMYVWPEAIARYAIVGWNEITGGTTKEVLYTNKGHTDVKTAMGDGTVVTQSAAFNAGTTTAIDLAADSDAEHSRFDHATILESSTTQNAIRDIVTHGDSTYCSQISKLPGASCGEPDYSKAEPTFFTLSTHSPVELHVYDSHGNHTGLVHIPATTDEPIEPGFLVNYESNIPGSSFEQQGNDASPETYIRLPDNGEKYTIKIQGTDIGSFTYDVQRERGSILHDNTILGFAEYANVPVTPLTVATTTMQFTPVSLKATSSPDFFAQTKPLSVDVDGDGVAEFQASSSATMSASEQNSLPLVNHCEWLRKIRSLPRLARLIDLCTRHTLKWSRDAVSVSDSD